MLTQTIDARALQYGDRFQNDAGSWLVMIRMRNIGITGAAIGCTEILCRPAERDCGALSYATYLHGERIRVAVL